MKLEKFAHNSSCFDHQDRLPLIFCVNRCLAATRSLGCEHVLLEVNVVTCWEIAMSAARRESPPGSLAPDQISRELVFAALLRFRVLAGAATYGSELSVGICSQPRRTQLYSIHLRAMFMCVSALILASMHVPTFKLTACSPLYANLEPPPFFSNDPSSFKTQTISPVDRH